ncbi:transposase [Methylocella tundrae]|uniref:Transposase n=1 Tax=Methylocella tundrae TaxID=227605 RepID=A0A8B6M5B6_METTU|nr:transposase [Methylocella tundrae]VTZ49559.1 transposase [Methylocella tundrae]
MKFGFIAKHRSIWPMAWLCEALGVSHSGFHAWLARVPSARALADEALAPKVRASFVASARTYGARRVWRDVLADGVCCGLHKVERLMGRRACGLDPAGAPCRGTKVSAWCPQSRQMCSIASSRRSGQIKSGSPTSPMSGRRRAGSTSPL